jgi:hypothetical protein
MRLGVAQGVFRRYSGRVRNVNNSSGSYTFTPGVMGHVDYR